MFIVVWILWYVVAVLCLNCVNADYISEKEWLKMPMWKRFGYLTVLPIIYLFLGAWKAFEK